MELSLPDEKERSKVLSVWDLDNGTQQDKIRLNLFFDLLKRFTDNVTNELDEMKRRYLEVYREDCKVLFSFCLDFETPENQEWIKSNFNTFKINFPKRGFSQSIKRKWIVTNIVRHCTNWLNEHYRFQQPIIYQNVELIRNTSIDSTKKLRNVSLISF